MDKGFLLNKKPLGYIVKDVSVAIAFLDFPFILLLRVHLLQMATILALLIWTLVQDFYFDWYFLIILSNINLFALSLV